MQPFGQLNCRIDAILQACRCGDGSDGRFNRVRSGVATLHGLTKIRKFGLFGSLAFLGLAFCVFGWGLGYKLSLYDQSQAPSHQIPKAKLLSRDEQSSTAKSPLVITNRTSTRVIYTAPTGVFLFLLLAISLQNTPALTRIDRPAKKLLHLHRAILNTLFVRPPPVLV